MLTGYERLQSGVIKQLNPEKYVYDKNYVIERYDSYGVLSDMMSYLRLGYLIGVIGRNPENVLDVGYGNGSFLKICQNANIETWGTDVSGYTLKYGEFIKWVRVLDTMEFDVITFFDSLEHFQDLSFLSELKCKYICISVPHCHYNEFFEISEQTADNYFLNWKHRRPNEHIWHFDNNSLINVMKEVDFKIVSTSNIEDTIRKPTNGKENILTCIFKRV